MKIISMISGMGGAGKSINTFHLGHILSEMGKRVLMIDADPQCSLTYNCIDKDSYERMCIEEKEYSNNKTKDNLNEEDTRPCKTLYYIMKNAVDGLEPPNNNVMPFNVKNKLDIIPGSMLMERLNYSYDTSVHCEEARLRVSKHDEEEILRVTKSIRSVAEDNGKSYDYVLIDTSITSSELTRMALLISDNFHVSINLNRLSFMNLISLDKRLKNIESDCLDSKSEFPSFLGYSVIHTRNKIEEYVELYEDFRTFEKENSSNIIFANSDMLLGNDIYNKLDERLITISSIHRCPVWDITDIMLKGNIDKLDKISEKKNEFKKYYISFAEELVRRLENKE
ncbi:MAG: ParA family protein [Tissierellales bacterium]|jgi:cellulose biosynthesis protein BcsQ|nr:ParA family protein [Tissierellales bacterium]